MIGLLWGLRQVLQWDYDRDYIVDYYQDYTGDEDGEYIGDYGDDQDGKYTMLPRGAHLITLKLGIVMYVQ